MTTADPATDQTLAAFEEAERTAAAVGDVAVRRTPFSSRVLYQWARGLPDGIETAPNSPSRYAWHDWTSCGHLPTPRLCFGITDLPGHLMCAPCWLEAAEKAPSECDWCGIGPRPDVTLWSVVNPVGPALVLATLCDYHVVSDSPTRTTDMGEYVRNTIRTHNGLSGADNRPPVK